MTDGQATVSSEGDVVGVSEGEVIVEIRDSRWVTPALHLADQIASVEEVQLILERIDPDRYSIFVVLEDDPESALDRIFDAEAKLYKEFRDMPFDLRVMKPGKNWDPLPLQDNSFLRYERL